MNKSILYASISAIILLSSIQVAMADTYGDCYKQGRSDALQHGSPLNNTAIMHCGYPYILAFNEFAYRLN